MTQGSPPFVPVRSTHDVHTGDQESKRLFRSLFRSVGRMMMPVVRERKSVGTGTAHTVVVVEYRFSVRSSLLVRPRKYLTLLDGNG